LTGALVGAHTLILVTKAGNFQRRVNGGHKLYQMAA